LLQSIERKGIAEESMGQTVEILLNLIEQLQSEVKELPAENQGVRDENKGLKGKKGQSEIKAKNKQGFTSNHSLEKERQTPKKDNKGSKKASIKIDREEIVEYPQELLPADAQFKGYEEVIIQDMILATDNVLYRKEKYYSPLEGKTYLAERPWGYEGEFGLGIKTLIISLYYGGNMTQASC
jgi:regulator of replication initiation timing